MTAHRRRRGFESMNSLRLLEIADYLKQRKYCSRGELMERFGISTATIHRDISALVRRQIVRKVHGGVMWITPETAPANAGSHFLARLDKNTDKKKKIADRAMELIADGDIIFLDSSTTVLHLAQRLRQAQDLHLTLITNSVHVIEEYRLFPAHFVMIGLGGNYNSQLHAFLGQSTLAALARTRITKAFVSAFGISGGGVTTYHEDHAEFLRQTLRRTERKYLLLDSTKFGRSGLFRIAGREDFDTVISDQPLPPYTPPTAP